MEKAEEIETNVTQTVTSFEELNLAEDLLRGIYGYGFEKPSIIQQRAFLPIMKGRDTIAQAQSGTGKTATFSIGMLSLIDPKSPECQALILAPTRELAKQIQKVIMCLGEFMGIVCYSCTGGTDIQAEKRKLREGRHQIIVGCPGRVLDMVEKKILKMDEADEMLSRGFKESIAEILKNLPEDVQIALFSATLPPDINELTKTFLRDPAKILLSNQELTLDGIKQFYIGISKDEWKFNTLVELYCNVDIGQCIIYCNSRKRVDEVTEKLKEKKFTISSMHGEMKQEERDLIMREFKSGSSRVLVTTDLMARGIDVQQVNLTINYDLPTRKETYIHRIGRAGRFGRKGAAINFVLPEDAAALKDLEAFYSTQINQMPLDPDQIFS
ncbi:LOW QUALITY PROTEIN: uncharacterized protein LOC127594475 [Hippocampus zosterae]|uniref:LOW QUALITY PROTEIN: uncharacterized protein LOC127594475 n=1 Tax=Hippocampus zosterae TaxID=109293 RepID=UPI00223D341F|nr:LOW QUALITY PROTEIN: uncharacterized protein LOC127594475 [Hippocampus zosterae]